MIKVNKDYYTIPEALTRIGCYRKIKRGIEGKDGKVYNGHHYKDGSVKTTLHLIYNSKCAYCESKIEHAATLQVEHYRPKDGLQGFLRIQHCGYYWLGCEWSNLLLACPNCNGKRGKGTKFPINGIRVYDGSMFVDILDVSSYSRNGCIANLTPLINEQPLLLNPEIDEPSEHLEFDSDGQIQSLSLRGTATISICNLERDLLQIERQKVRDKLLKEIKRAITKKILKLYNEVAFLSRLNDVFEDVFERTNPTEEYTLWGRYFYNNFEECFVQKLNPAYQNGIRKAFEAYKNNELN